MWHGELLYDLFQAFTELPLSLVVCLAPYSMMGRPIHVRKPAFIQGNVHDRRPVIQMNLTFQ